MTNKVPKQINKMVKINNKKIKYKTMRTTMKIYKKTQWSIKKRVKNNYNILIAVIHIIKIMSKKINLKVMIMKSKYKNLY